MKLDAFDQYISNTFVLKLIEDETHETALHCLRGFRHNTLVYSSLFLNNFMNLLCLGVNVVKLKFSPTITISS